LAMLDGDAVRVAAVLDGLQDKDRRAAITSVLERKSVGGRPFFVLHGRIYPVDTATMREAFGSAFEFEDEHQREAIASWLDMIDVRDGDTLLHLALRLNGLEEPAKVMMAVELLGRGSSIEVVNSDGDLPANVDGAFKIAYMRELKPWRERRQANKHDEVKKVVAMRRAAAEARRRKEEQAEKEAQQASQAAARERARSQRKEARARRKFHEELDRTLDRLDREARGERTGVVSGRGLLQDAQRWFGGLQAACVHRGK
jgi:hypothetical protein